MARIVVNEAGFKKPGPGINNASFAQVLWDRNKKEYKVDLNVQSQTDNAYIVIPPGGHGTIEVSAPNFRPNKVDVVENVFQPSEYTVWLSR